MKATSFQVRHQLFDSEGAQAASLACAETRPVDVVALLRELADDLAAHLSYERRLDDEGLIELGARMNVAFEAGHRISSAASQVAVSSVPLPAVSETVPATMRSPQLRLVVSR